MSDLDDEFARFQAEMKALDEDQKKEEQEQTKESASAEASAPAPKKRKVISQPQVISAPPKPSAASSSYLYEELSANVPAALSGFLPGTSGAAALETTLPSRSSAPQKKHVPFVDMATGRPLGEEEQSQMASQQSVYGYDPRKSTQPTGDSKAKPHVRVGGGKKWVDPTLDEWPDNDYRLFVGDLGNEVTDEYLSHAFAAYPSFQRAKVVREKYSQKTRGYGFVSFSDPFDCAKALREMNGRYLGNRPMKISKSKWQDRDIKVARKKERKKRLTRVMLQWFFHDQLTKFRDVQSSIH